MSKYKTCKGFKDLMPADYKRYMFLKDSIEEVGNLYGYKPVQPACIDESNLFKDCYDKEIESNLFTIDGRFINSASLNFDSTVSVLRGVVESKLYVDKSLPLKLMYLNNMYRYNRRDKSKACYTQFGFECIADKSPYLDVEHILANIKVLSSLGFNNYNLRICNVGEDEEYYKTIINCLDNLDVGYEEDDNIDNLPYCTGIAFSIDVDEYDSVIYGGRYDGLIDIIGNVLVGCVGSKVNFDKLIKLMDDYEAFPDFKEEVDFYIIPVNSRCFEYGLGISEILRDYGAVVEIHYKEYDLKRLDDLLDRVNVTYSLVIDEEDVKKKTVKVRNSLSKQQSCVLLKDFLKDLESLEEHHHKGE